MVNQPPVKKSAAREWVESIVIALLLALFIREFFVQAFKIPSGSMVPTLLVGDRLMVNKLRYGPKVRFTDKRLPGFSKSRRGDIIVFIFPENPKQDFIKRRHALFQRVEHIVSGLASMSLKSVLLDTQSLIELYYNTYNPDIYNKEKLVEIDKLRVEE